MEGLPEEFEFEIEALRATYGDEAVHVEPASSSGSGGSPAVALVSLPVAPRCEAEHEHFVAGRLVMSVGAGYPAEPPAVQLADAKGLGDARLAGIQSALEAEAAAMSGELQLGHLCETALDQLTAANQPEGGCAFCLEPLLGTGGGEGGDGGLPVVRLACFHCYHTACFAPWWQWQQRRSAQREAQLWSEYKAMAPLKLEEEGIRREPLTWLAAGAGGGSCGSDGLHSATNGAAEAAAEEEVEGEGEEGGSGGGKRQGPGEAYVLLCPACRADIAPSSLAHAWHQLQAATADSWSGGAQGSVSSRAALERLPAEQRQALLAMQQRHAAVMRRQQACGGIVDATHSVSISDLQQAAAAAAAAEAAAAEAAALAAAQQAQQAQQAQHGGPGRGGGRRGRGGPHPPAGRGPPPGFPGRQQGEGRGGGGRQPPSGRGRGGGRGRAGRHGDGPATCATSLAAAEGALAGMQLADHPQQQQQQPRRPQQHQAQQQHEQGSSSRSQGGGGRGGRGGRHGRSGDGRGRGHGRESAAGSATAGNTPHNS